MFKNFQNFPLRLDGTTYRYQHGGVENRGAHCHYMQDIMVQRTKLIIFNVEQTSNLT